MTDKPRIGLTMRLELATRRYYLGRDYSEAIEGAGGIPLHIPLIVDREYISAAMDGLDGVLLPGADCDVDPRYYSEEPHPRLKTVVPEKDQTDRLVLEAADERGLPVLAICYGMQALNVYRGGTLIQDIESQIPGCIKHEQGLPLDRRSHTVSVSGDGLLASLLSSTGRTGELEVNSHHHQAIGKLGRGLRAVAEAKDGVVECIEDTSNDRFILGVQWHPEIDWRRDHVSKAIFSGFVESAAIRRGSEARRELLV